MPGVAGAFPSQAVAGIGADVDIDAWCRPTRRVVDFLQRGSEMSHIRWGEQQLGYWCDVLHDPTPSGV
ncbi:hypothetical protein CR157_17110 [Halomonas sp. LBP4]|nr:hypothetical protein CR157_17110 [Halomonas sp. LBP4]